jgi:hypothetical protein
VLLGLGTLSGVGATAGTALTGAIDGTAVTGVDQALVLDDDTAVNVNGANDSVTTVSADGTRFRAASQVTQGEQYEVELLLRNRADVNLAGELLLAVDEPLQISATGGEFAQIQRVAKNRFSLAVSRLANGTDGDTAPDTVTLTIAVPNGADPGFYEITGTITTEGRSSAAFNRLVGATITFSGDSTDSGNSFDITEQDSPGSISIKNGGSDDINVDIRITDRYSNPISGETVELNEDVNGSFSNTDPETDSNGLAESTFQTTSDDNDSNYTITATVALQDGDDVELKVDVKQGNPNS